MQKIFFNRPFLAFLPLLLLYVTLVIIQNAEPLIGDEGRYLQFAENILNGFYSPPPPEINLWNGPGFPLYLVPFVALGIPHLVIKLFNAFLYYLVLVLFYKTLCRFLDKKKSFISSLLFACYYMPYKSLPHILSETLTIFLVAAITFFASIYFSDHEKIGKSRYMAIVVLLLAMLALTKVIFGPVYLFAAIAFLLVFLYTKNLVYMKCFSLVICALLICAPYLFYTWSLTGKIFYWSNAGGKSLYWMSNPVKGEWGEWHKDPLSATTQDTTISGKIASSHKSDFEQLNQYSGIERDDKFKELASRNIREHPGKFIVNWIANWGRMFFNYPVSYTPLRMSTIGNMLANIPVLILLAYSALLTWRNKNKVPDVFKFLLCLAGIYLLGSSLLSAYDRMFYILAPLLAFWVCYSISFLSPKAERSIAENQNI